MRRSVVLLALGALALGACAGGSGAVSNLGQPAAYGGNGVDAIGGAIVQATAPPGVVTLTVEPSDGAVFGLPAAVPAGTNLLLFNVADVPYQMTVFAKNPSVTDSWDVILACGITDGVATVVGSVVAEPGAGSDSGITVSTEGDNLLALIPLGTAATEPPPAETAAPSPSEAPSVAPTELASGSPAAETTAPTLAPTPTEAPAATCPPGGIAGATSAPAESAAPSVAEPTSVPSTAGKTPKPHKTPHPKPTPTPAATPIPGIPDLTNAAWQVFTVTPAGTPPGETPGAPQLSPAATLESGASASP